MQSEGKLSMKQREKILVDIARKNYRRYLVERKRADDIESDLDMADDIIMKQALKIINLRDFITKNSRAL